MPVRDALLNSASVPHGILNGVLSAILLRSAMFEWIKQRFPFSFGKPVASSVIGIDIGSSAIKVVQLKRNRGVATLETYGEIALGLYANTPVGQATNLGTDVIARALTDVLREASVTTSAGGMSIPFTSSLVTMIKMPALEASQLNKMIPLEARKYIPVSINEVSLDWFIVPEEDQGLLSAGDKREAPSRGVRQIDVLLVAIHNDVLSRFNQIIQAASLAIGFLEIEIFSGIRSVIGQTAAPLAVLDIGAAKSKLYIVEYGVIKNSHLINRGSQDITSAVSSALGMPIEKAEETKREWGLTHEDPQVTRAMKIPLEHILTEANRVLNNYQQRSGRTISFVTLIGGGSVLKGLLPLATEHLETEVRLGDPFSKVEAPAFLADVLKEAGPEFAVAVGVALRRLQENG